LPMMSLEFSIEYQDYVLEGKVLRPDNITLLWADCLEFWKPQPPGTLRACPGLYRDCFTCAVHCVIPQKSTDLSYFLFLPKT